MCLRIGVVLLIGCLMPRIRTPDRTSEFVRDQRTVSLFGLCRPVSSASNLGPALGGFGRNGIGLQLSIGMPPA
jgi:hypothetical protein